MKEVYEFLDTLGINEDNSLVVAVSYGPDSMFLLDCLINKYRNNKIICAHVNHGLRKESNEEAKLLKKYCKDKDILFELMKIEEYKNNKFTEAEARNKRYDFFDKIMKKYDSKYLFTAHHGDDLTETILMRLVRGSNMKGYSGINLISNRKNYRIIRPLLYLTKGEIEKACNMFNIPFAVDKSNYDNKYTRNRYRNNILKFLKEENKNVHLKFLDFSNTLQEYDYFVNEIVNCVYKKVVNDNKIDVYELKKEKFLIVKKVIELYLFNIYKGDIKLVSAKHTDMVINMLHSSKSNILLSMPGKRKLIKSYNKIYFDNEKVYNSFCYVIDWEVNLPNGYKITKIETLENTTNYVTAFNSKEISLPIYVRNRQNGDKIKILGLKGSKKIKDVFIDEKVSTEERELYPVVIDASGQVLWLPGLKKSKYDKSKQGNYDIILKYQREV